VGVDDALGAVFRAALPEGSSVPTDGELEPLLREYVATARSAWPHFDVSSLDLVRHLAKCSLRGMPPPAEYAGDLLLAVACLQGCAPAIATFHAAYGNVIDRVLMRRRTGTADAADVTQMVYERLLVPRGSSAPRLGGYRGQGPLRSWVSTAAATTASGLRRAEGRRLKNERRDPATIGAVMAVINPELAYIKRLYKTEIEQAIETALNGLDARASLLLRLHFGERMSIDQLGALYKVNRATAARRVIAARDTVANAIRADLRRRLKLSDSDYQSLVALLRSELDMTIADLVGRRTQANG